MSFLVEVRNLKKYFPVEAGIIFKKTVGHVRAVDGVSFGIKEGETLGLVGESGCGKTTVARTMLRLTEPTSGEIYYGGKNVLDLKKRELNELRENIQYIFQDPYSSLNPRMTVYDIIGEPFDIHKVADKEEKFQKIQELMDKVGLAPFHIYRYPHEFSGGQRQRIGIARALALNPKLVIADEPTSALDVSVRSQILNLMNDLQKEFKLTYLFISHDLSMIKHISDRVAVMYVGKLVELADVDTLFEAPKHPYTEALVSAIPIPNPKIKKRRIILRGDVPNPINPPSGCRFHPRCHYAKEICSKEEPEFKDNGDEHFYACYFPR
ncbi:MAG: ABC transporter ATP-binding protein [Candidatus Methanofastidiosia archaeon]